MGLGYRAALTLPNPNPNRSANPNANPKANRGGGVVEGRPSSEVGGVALRGEAREQLLVIHLRSGGDMHQRATWLRLGLGYGLGLGLALALTLSPSPRPKP